MVSTKQSPPVLSDRTSIESRLVELREILAIDQSTVPTLDLADHLQKRLLAESEVPRLEAVLVELDRRAALESDQARRSAIEAEIAALDEQVKTFEASLPAAREELRAMAKNYAAALDKVIQAGRVANSQKSRRFELSLQLEGRSIRQSDIVPVSIHLPQTPALLTLNHCPADDVAIAMGSAWNIGRLPIVQLLEEK